MSPKVSIIMSVWNGEAYLAEAIQSMLDQTFTDFEFIIVDDGSTDHSAQIIQEYARQDARIKLILLGENMGLASALNRGIEYAQGQYIARMDSDDISKPSRLQQQTHYLESHPDVGVLGTQMQVVDKDKTPLFSFDVPLQHSLIVWNLFFGRTFAHPSVLMRRDSLLQVGAYDSSISAAQDVDLWSRLLGQVKFANLPDQLVVYRTHPHAASIQKADQQKIVIHATLKRLLARLWGNDISDTTIDRFLKIRSGKPKLTKDEFAKLRVDLQRLMESMLVEGWILPDEKPLIDGDMNRLLDFARPQKSFWDRLLNRKK